VAAAPSAARTDRVAPGLPVQSGLVLLAFALGVLGLLALALRPQDSAEVEPELVPAILSGMFQLWCPRPRRSSSAFCWSAAARAGRASA
jgi:hypothetical protein